MGKGGVFSLRQGAQNWVGRREQAYEEWNAKRKVLSKAKTLSQGELLKVMCNPARQLLAGLTDTGSPSTQQFKSTFSINHFMISSNTLRNWGRGAYDTTGCPKPPPRPRPS